jgi:RNA polymerase sigma factor (sigma-70 family)
MNEKPLELTLKLRNNLLKKKRTEMGFSTVQIAEKMVVTYQNYVGLENMRMSPMGKNGWRPTAIRIAEYYGVSCEELWPDIILLVKNPEVVAELNQQRAEAMLTYAQQQPLQLPSAEDMLIEHGKNQMVTEGLETLTPKQKRALEARFFEEKTLEQVGDEFGVTKETARRIIIDGVRNLKKALL